MSRFTGNVYKLCRREGMKLFLKGQRCFTNKCAVEKRDYPPASTRRADPKSPNMVFAFARSRS